MTEFATNYPWILVLICTLLGIGLGVLGTRLFEQRKSGGRTVEDIQQEMDEYKEEVGKHFATTSELFRDMTEKYRDVYNHLASGSQALCEDSMEHARLEFTEAKPIEASQEAPFEGEEPTSTTEHPTEQSDSLDSKDERDDPPLGV